MDSPSANNASDSGSNGRQKQQAASSSFPSSPDEILNRLRENNSDEGAVWLSHLICELWPFAANIAQFVIYEYVQPALIANFPAGLPTPRFKKIDIGSDPFVVNSIQVYQRKYGKDDYAAVIEADISYEGRPDIELSLSDLTTFGVNHVKVNGRVEIVIRPLLDRVPLIGALQVAFINQPDIDYALTGLARVANQSLVRGIIQNTVESELAKIAVLPNRVAYKCAPDIDYFRFSAQPVGVLRVAALCGAGFPSTDRNFLKQAVGLSELPDVYLFLTHGVRRVQTVHVNDTADPVWDNQLFDFVLMSESSEQLLRVDAYDHDQIGQDDYLGSAKVLVRDLIRTGTKEITLEGAPENAEPTVKLAAKWLSVSSDLRHVQHAIMTQRSDPLRPKECSSLLLTVEVDEAHNLPAGKRPYVRVCVGTLQVRTSAAYDLEGVFTVQHPQFEQAFHVLLEGTVDASVKVEFHVEDESSKTEMGWAYSSLAEVVDAGPEGKTYKFALMRAEKANASLRVRMKLGAVLDQPPLWKVLADPSSVEGVPEPRST